MTRPWGRFLWGALIAGLLLFLWSGLTQLFPWGVPSSHVVVSQETGASEPFLAGEIEVLPPFALTTPRFDLEFANRVGTLTTDETFSWIVSRPLAYYQPSGYFARELLTQLLVGLLLSAVALSTRRLPPTRRLGIFGLTGVGAAVSSYGTLSNWWGLTTAYALGVSVNLVVGWLLVGFVLSRFVVPRRSDRTGNASPGTASGSASAGGVQRDANVS